MNVCMVAYSFYDSDNRVRRYAESLAQRGEYVEALSLRRPGQAAYEIVRGVHVHRIQERVVNERGPLSYLIRLLLFFFRSAFFLTKTHLRRPYGLIHVHSVPDFQVFATLLPRFTGAKIILDIHDIVPEFYASKFGVSEQSLAFRLLLLVEKLSCSFAHHVIIANHIWYEKLLNRSVKTGHCTAMINYPDCSIFYRRPEAAPDPSRFVLCYPGTLNWHQGLDVAVRAMAIVRETVPHAQLWIVGDGAERDNLKRLVHELGLADTVLLRGLVPIEGVATIMSSVDLGVVPKRSNSFGNEAFSTKIMEFMAMGVPVLASETRIDRYYFDGELVRFFQSGSPEDMAVKIIELIDNLPDRQALIAKANAFIAQNSWDVKKVDYLSLVDHLVSPTLGAGESATEDRSRAAL